jgi:hypothetical protein
MTSKEKHIAISLKHSFFYHDIKEPKGLGRLKVFSAEASTGEALPIFITPFGL